MVSTLSVTNSPTTGIVAIKHAMLHRLVLAPRKPFVAVVPNNEWAAKERMTFWKKQKKGNDTTLQYHLWKKGEKRTDLHYTVCRMK